MSTCRWDLHPSRLIARIGILLCGRVEAGWKAASYGAAQGVERTDSSLEMETRRVLSSGHRTAAPPAGRRVVGPHGAVGVCGVRGRADGAQQTTTTTAATTTNITQAHGGGKPGGPRSCLSLQVYRHKKE